MREALAGVGDYFGSNQPAWTAAAVPGLWMEGYLHEIAATAVLS